MAHRSICKHVLSIATPHSLIRTSLKIVSILVAGILAAGIYIGSSLLGIQLPVFATSSTVHFSQDGIQQMYPSLQEALSSIEEGALPDGGMVYLSSGIHDGELRLDHVQDLVLQPTDEESLPILTGEIYVAKTQQVEFRGLGIQNVINIRDSEDVTLTGTTGDDRLTINISGQTNGMFVHGGLGNDRLQVQFSDDDEITLVGNTIGSTFQEVQFDSTLEHVEVSAPAALEITDVTLPFAGSLVAYADGELSVNGDITILGGELRLESGDRLVSSAFIDASSEQMGHIGGAVTLLGTHVTLADNATIDASGHAGGGTILVGGDYQGANPAVRNARAADIGPNVTINADAITHGIGGTIVIWSDETTKFFGQISARGGLLGGDGGLAEVSGKEHLLVGGHADLHAVHGDDGFLLLDPGSVSIVDGGNTAPGGMLNSFNDAWIAAQLGSASLAINTSNSSDGGTQNLTVDGAVNITWSSGNTLSLSAGNTITLDNNATINATGNGGVTLAAGANVVMNSGSDISVVNGNLTITANDGGLATGNFAGIFTASGSALTTSGTGDILMTGYGGDDAASGQHAGVQNFGTISSTGSGASAGTITIAGYGGTGTNLNDGVQVRNSITSVDGAISITGQTGTVSGFLNFGVKVQSAKVRSTGTGANAATITIVGTASSSSGSSNNSGVRIEGSNASVDSVAGNIQITGAGGGGSLSPGVQLLNGQVNSTGTGASAASITIIGTGTSNSNSGVELDNANAEITTVDGAVSIDGTGTTGNADGVRLQGDSEGIFSTGSAAIQITGEGAGSGDAVDLQGGTIGGGSATGTITFSGEPQNLNSGTIQTSGSLILEPAAGSVTVTFNGGSDAVTLGSGTVSSGGTTYTLAGSVASLNATTSAACTISANPNLSGNLSVSCNSIALNASVTTGGTQTYSGPVTLGANVTLTTNDSDMSFTSTVNGAHQLQTRTGGTGAGATGSTGGSSVVSFAGAVGGSIPLSSLDIEAGHLHLNGGALTTSGNIVLEDINILLNASTNSTTLTSSGGGNITLGLANSTFLRSATNGQESLILNSSGATTLAARVGTSNLRLNALTTDAAGTLVFDAIEVNTTGVQTYNDPVTLKNNLTVQSTGNGNITFASTVDDNASVGSASLIVQTGGVTIFGNALGGSAALTSLTTDAAGTVQIGGNITTNNGAITLNDNGTLTGAATLNAGTANITLGGTMNGNYGLTLNSTGTTTLGGAIGGSTALSSLSTNSGGTTALNTGAVTTSGNQTYGDNLTLGADTILTGATIRNIGTINGTTSGIQSLAIAGNADIDAALGGTTPLQFLTVSGTTSLGANLSTNNGVITLNNNVTLTANSTLNSGSGNITLGGTVDGAFGLALNSTGATSTDGAVGGSTALTSFATNAGGTTELGGNVSTANGAISFGDNVALTASSVLSAGSGNITFDGTVNGAFALTLNSSGATTLSSEVGGSAALANLTTNAGGTTAIDGGAITTTGTQTYGDAATISTDTTFTAGGMALNGTLTGTGHALTLRPQSAASAINLGTGAIDAGLQLDNTELAQLQDGFSSITIGDTTNGVGTVTVNASAFLDPVTIVGSSVIVNGALSNSASNAIILIADSIDISGAIQSAGALTIEPRSSTTTIGLGGGTGTLNLGTSELNQLTDGFSSITIGRSDGTGTVALGTDIPLNDPTTITGDAGGYTLQGSNTATTFTITGNNTGTITNGGITLNNNGSLTFENVTTLQGGSGSDELVGRNIANTWNITAGDAGTYAGINISSIENFTGGSATDNFVLGSGVNFTGALDGGGGSDTLDLSAYSSNLAVNLTSISGGNVTGVVGGFSNIENIDSGSGTDIITLGAASAALIVGSGIITSGTVLNYSAVESLDLTTTDVISVPVDPNLSGNLALDGGSISLGVDMTTGGDQTYTGPMSLTADSTLDAGSGNITLNSAVDGAFALALNSTGSTTIGGAVGNTTALTSLTTNAGGSTAINGGSIETTGNQTYNDAVTLGADTGLTGATINNVSTIDGTSVGTESLTITGNATIGDAIGGTTPLEFLSISGTTALNADVTTTAASGGTGNQFYSGNVTLQSNPTVTSNNGAVSFGGTIDGNTGLTIAAGSGSVAVSGVVGGSSAPDSFTISSAGQVDLENVSTVNNSIAVTGTDIDLNGTNYASDSGSITFSGPVDLDSGANTIFGNGTTGAITFNDTINGSVGLIISNSDTLTLNGAVGGTAALSSMAVNSSASGSVAINGGAITTTADQSYSKPAVLGANATLNAGSGNITLSDTVDGGFDLALNSTGVTAIDGTVGGTTSLSSFSTNAGGTTQLGSNISTNNGPITLNDNVTLTAASALDSGSGDITFNGTVDGGFGLTLNSTGATTAIGSIGGTSPLSSFTTDAGGSTQLSGGAITTTGGQSYSDATTVTDDTTLTTGAIALSGTFSGTGHVLTILPQTASAAINLGTGATDSGLQLDDTELTQLQDGFSSITIGDAANGSGTVTINASAFLDPVTIAGGNITVNGAITNQADAGITLASSNTATIGGSGQIATMGSGTLTITATRNIALSSGSTLSVVDGNLTLSANAAGTAVGSFAAINLNNATAQTAGTGSISMTGQGGDSGGGLSGVLILSGSVVQSTAAGGGGITINGTAGVSSSSSGSNHGVRVNGAGSIVSSVDGDIQVTGIAGGGSSSTQNHGLYVDDGGQVVASGSAAITGVGAGGFGANNQHGVLVVGVNSKMQVSSGTLDVIGTAGGATNSSGQGVRLTANSAGLLSTGSGDIQITGISGSTNDGVRLQSANAGTIGGASASGDITITADQIRLDDGSIQSTGALTIQPVTASTSIGLGNGASGTMNLDNSELALLADGFSTIAFGHSNGTGTVTLGTGFTLNDSTTITGDPTSGYSLQGSNTATTYTITGVEAGTISNGGITFSGDGSLAFSNAVTLSGGSGNDTLIGRNISNTWNISSSNSGTYSGIAYSSIENITGGSAADNFILDAGLNFTGVLDGGGGSDTLNLSAYTTDLVASLTDIGDGSVAGAVAGFSNIENFISGSGSDDLSMAAGNDPLSVGSGTIANGSTLTHSNVESLSMSTTSTITVSADPGLSGTLALNGSLIEIGSDITTVDDQSYTGPVELGANARLTSSGEGAISFSDTVNGARQLTIDSGNYNSSGSVTFNDAVGDSTELTALRIDAGEAILNGSAIATTGLIDLQDADILLDSPSDSTTISSSGGGNILLGFANSPYLRSNVDGEEALIINTSGQTELGARIGTNSQRLSSITTDAAGTLGINAIEINTTGAQTYNDPVTLQNNLTIESSSGGDISFNSTVDDNATAGDATLNIQTSGATLFGSAVGGTAALTALTTDAGGSTEINGGAIETTGNQTYNDAVTLGADTVLTGTTVINADSLDGASSGSEALLIAGNATINGDVGGGTALESVSVSGTTAINANVTTTAGGGGTGDQSYGDDVTLQLNPALMSNNGDISFGGTIDGGTGLTIVAGTGAVAISGVAGGSSPLDSFTISSAGQVDLGNVSTRNNSIAVTGMNIDLNGSGYASDIGSITFSGPVDLDSGLDTTFGNGSTGAITFTGTINGALGLIISNNDAATFDGEIGNVSPLTEITVNSSVSGTVAINGGSITTSGDQSYSNPVVLGANTTLDAGSGNITLSDTVNGAHELMLSSIGVTDIDGTMGGTVALASLTTDASGTTQLGGNVSAFGNTITFNDPVILTTDVTVTDSGSTGIIFNESIDSNGTPRDLTLNTSGGGDTRFHGEIGSVSPLGELTTDSSGLTAIDTAALHAGTVTLNDSVAISVTSAITAAEINFGGGPDSVEGDDDLSLIPATSSADIVLGGPSDSGAATLDLTDSDLLALDSGFTGIFIGDAKNGSGAVTLDSATIPAPVSIFGATVNDLSGIDLDAPSVNFYANVAPGASPGTLTIDGDLTFPDDSSLTVEISGTVPNSDFDQIVVDGAVSIGSNVSLTPTFNYSPTQGTTFTIIDNDGFAPVTGTFNGLAEGTIFYAGGQETRISYVGGDGNDVVLEIPIHHCYASHDGGATIFSSVYADALQDAIDDAANGATVRIAGTCAGTQSRGGSDQTVIITKNLTLVGGYNSAPSPLTTLAPESYTTTLDADSTGRLMVINEPVTVTVANLTLQNGDAMSQPSGNGGAIEIVTSTVSITNTVIQNSEAVDGGAVWSSGTVTISHSSLVDNIASQDGGALYNDGTLNLNSSAIIGNQADDSGGGVYNNSQFAATNSTFSDNLADLVSGEGGAIMNNSVAELTHVTVVDNAAAVGAGAGSTASAGITTTLHATLIISNNGGSDLELGAGGSSVNSFVSGDFNVVGTMDADITLTGSDDITNVTGSQVEPLADNDGPTLTHALLITSQAVDRADTGNCPTTDQRDVARPLDGNGDSAPVCDSGAYEAASIAPINFYISDEQSVEGDSGTQTMTFTIVRSSSVLTSTIRFATISNTAIAGVDYQAHTETITFPIDTLTETVTVNITGDSVVEANETFTASLSSVVNGVIVNGTAVGTIENDDGATVNIGNTSGSESAGPQTVAITLSTSVDVPISVTVATEDGSAMVSDSDYESLSQVVVFGAGDLSKSVAITVTDDSVVEADESYTIGLSDLVTNSRSISIGTATGLGTIENDDSATVNIGDASGSESAGPQTVAITLSTSVDVPISVTVTTADGSAMISDNDYESLNQVVVFGVGEVNQSVAITVTDDSVVEADESYTIGLSDLVNSSRSIDIGKATGLGTIENDDGVTVNIGNTSGSESAGPQTVAITLSTSVDVPISVTVTTADGRAMITDTDYKSLSQVVVFDAGDLSKSVAITITDDSVVEADESYTIGLSDLVTNSRSISIGTATGLGTIENDDGATVNIGNTSGSESAGPQTVAITLSTSVDVPISVTVTTADGSAMTANSDYESLSQVVVFGAGEVSKSVAITVTDDSVVEADESYTIGLSDLFANERAVDLGNASRTGTIVNDDGAVLHIADARVVEADGTAMVTVTSSAPSATPINVSYSTSDGSANTQGDYVEAFGTITLTSGITQATINVDILNDDIYENEEFLTISLNNSAGAALGDPTATIIIVDDDVKQFTLDSGVAGNGSGVIALEPEPINGTYANGTLVTATAIADDGSAFTGWQGDCIGSDTCTLLMDADKMITATFTLNQYEITTLTDGTGSGFVKLEPEAELYDHGTVVTVTAMAEVSSTFTGWQGDCDGSDICVLVMDEHKEAIATFMQDEIGNQPPIIRTQGFELDENSPVGTLVGTVETVDVDVEQTITYSITEISTQPRALGLEGLSSGTVGTSADQADALFAIEETTGDVTVSGGPLDYESTSHYLLTVQVTDNGTPALSSSAIITITLRDVNEEPITLDSIPPQRGLTGSQFSLMLNPATFRDADLGNDLTYDAALTDGSELPLWLTFDPETLTFAGLPEDSQVLDIRVTAIDSLGRQATTEFSLEVVAAPTSLDELEEPTNVWQLFLPMID